MAILATQVQALPPELFDRVFKLTFIPYETDYHISIDPSYQPPSYLQVSQATRETATKAYYKKCRFYIERQLAPVWINSLGFYALKRIKEIRMATEDFDFNDTSELRESRDDVRDEIMMIYRECGCCIYASRIKICVGSDGLRRKVWVGLEDLNAMESSSEESESESDDEDDEA